MNNVLSPWFGVLQLRPGFTAEVLKTPATCLCEEGISLWPPSLCSRATIELSLSPGENDNAACAVIRLPPLSGSEDPGGSNQ